MQEEKPTTTNTKVKTKQIAIREENKGNSSKINLEKLMSKQTRFAFLLLFIFTLIVTVIPELMVNFTMSYYNDSTKANMHVTTSTNLIIAFITLLYVLLTWNLVSETREMRKLQTEPNVYLFLEPRDEHNQITDLFIQNIGLGPAYNIEFDVLSDIIFMVDGKADPKEMWVSCASIIKNGIKYLAPNQRKRIFSTEAYEVRKLNSENNLDMKIRYESSMHEKKKSVFYLNFYEFPENGITMVTDPFEERLLKAVKNIEKHMQNVSEEMKSFVKDPKNRKE